MKSLKEKERDREKIRQHVLNQPMWLQRLWGHWWNKNLRK
jgi:hypothetical protein